MSASTRGGRRDNSFVASPDTPRPRISSPCSLRPPFTSPAGSQLPRVFTCTRTRTHGTVLSGSALKVRDLYRLPRSLGPSGNSIWNYAGSRTRISWHEDADKLEVTLLLQLRCCYSFAAVTASLLLQLRCCSFAAVTTSLLSPSFLATQIASGSMCSQR